MHTFNPTLSSIYVQAPAAQINLSPTQRTKFCSTQAMPISKEDRCAIPGASVGSLSLFASFWRPTRPNLVGLAHLNQLVVLSERSTELI